MTKTQIKHAAIIAELSIVDAELGLAGEVATPEIEAITLYLYKRNKRRLWRGYGMVAGLGGEDIIKKVKELFPEVQK